MLRTPCLRDLAMSSAGGWHPARTRFCGPELGPHLVPNSTNPRSVEVMHQPQFCGGNDPARPPSGLLLIRLGGFESRTGHHIVRTQTQAPFEAWGVFSVHGLSWALGVVAGKAAFGA